MDYLWELRRRQQAALNRLLTGSPSKEETTAEEEVLRRAAEGAEKAPAGQEKGISRPTAEQGKLIGQAESGEALSSAKRKAVKHCHRQSGKRGTERKLMTDCWMG